MKEKSSLTSRRPAEAATGVTGAVVAVLVATTGLSTELATALVAVVAFLPTLVTSVVSATRSTAAGMMLVGLTDDVAGLATTALKAASADSVPLTEKTTALKDVAESISSWSDVLAAEPGTKPAAKS